MQKNENMQDRASEKRNMNKDSQSGSMSQKKSAAEKNQPGNQPSSKSTGKNQSQGNQHKNQQQGSNQNWKNQRDENDIESPGQHEEDDSSTNEKKIPQMSKHGDKNKF
jgi:hypothetical protein